MKKKITEYHLIQGDALQVLPTMDQNSIDLVVTSPPYNVGIDYEDDKITDDKPFKEYYNFAFETVKEIYRVLKKDGRFCIEIAGSGRNFPSSWCWQDVAYKVGFNLYSEITIAHRKQTKPRGGVG